jgi:Fur family ferric uptake transcriptional regulator
VLKALADADRHLDSREILAAVAADDPTVSRATVFRTLETLTRLSLVRPTYLDSHAPVYVLMPEHGHHAHIVCLKCSTIVEVEDCAVDTKLEQIARRHKVSVTGHLLELYGVCEACSEAASDPRQSANPGQVRD